MLFTKPYLLIMLTSVYALTIPENTSLNPATILDKRNSYNCKGAGSCATLAVKYCDQAVNTLIRNNDLNYGSAGSGKFNSGNCWANSDGYGCGVFIQGSDSGTGQPCVINGNQMWWDYQEIRGQGCRICGSKQYDSGCEVTINYVSGCDNRG